MWVWSPTEGVIFNSFLISENSYQIFKYYIKKIYKNQTLVFHIWQFLKLINTNIHIFFLHFTFYITYSRVGKKSQFRYDTQHVISQKISEIWEKECSSTTLPLPTLLRWKKPEDANKILQYLNFFYYQFCDDTNQNNASFITIQLYSFEIGLLFLFLRSIK